jgi:hypothetical protein
MRVPVCRVEQALAVASINGAGTGRRLNTLSPSDLLPNNGCSTDEDDELLEELVGQIYDDSIAKFKVFSDGILDIQQKMQAFGRIFDIIDFQVRGSHTHGAEGFREMHQAGGVGL